MTTTAIETPTKNTLAESAREQMIELLQRSTASSLDLQTQAKVAHWNVKGPSFIALHELFDQAADQIRGYTDELAERLMQLGGQSTATVQGAAELTVLPKYSTEIRDGREHVDAFSGALAAFGEHTREAIDKASGLGDEASADIYTEITRGVDKLLWFVESHNL